ncbi:MAG: SAM-dependent methyltransferase [Flavobacterium sp. MedPE-SWcel]|uniref:class I SAM-dependent methyltransferase n=1 Tax=uncultured Flavobacterium sp. TaxID=165435 RepID=UPI00091B4745|nr:class I SAM-dependent methyltransferase [uncultured Flavobacterium sp.]OIQ18055.1 MAG: SAM-dependent methyltransferase [Flavobacterium sp. MedPE-SWcel]
MDNNTNYIETNKEAWNTKTAYHVDSEFYDMPSFLKGKSTLNNIELELLGDVSGKKILHLQCHFGQDTLSLGRLGAEVTGVDLSNKAIEKANELSTATGVAARFICCDIYSLPEHLDEQFDIVFTSYGTIGWLPDLNKWAAIISRFLKPKGTFIIADFHPVIWMFDNDFNSIAYNYFKDAPIIENETGTYADTDAPIENTTISWNHGTSEVINSLINNGISLELFNEYDYSPYNCFNEMEEYEPKKYRIASMGNKLPFVFAIKATKD